MDSDRGELLNPLRSTDIWKTATVADYGATVEWHGDDLAIDAYHLYQIAEDQRDFDVEDLRKWQEEIGLPIMRRRIFLASLYGRGTTIVRARP